MRRLTTRVPTVFAPATRSSAEPGRLPREIEGDALERLRIELARRLVRPSSNAPTRRRLRRAIAKAEALAFTTPYPLLVLPLLAEELARAAHAQPRLSSATRATPPNRR